ncbi:MAG: flagellar hook-basal body complex protein FliE [Lachnospiraceae bacterium]|nr:flagellar hook-basal body complex protein FliE [Lachnospiraceae bacterium]
MDITSITALNESIGIGTTSEKKVTSDNTEAFSSLLNSAISMYKDADLLQKKAEQAEMNFAMGYSDNTHDLALAQQKANIALQYTVKVTNKFLEAYKEIMNMQL